MGKLKFHDEFGGFLDKKRRELAKIKLVKVT